MSDHRVPYLRHSYICLCMNDNFDLYLMTPKFLSLNHCRYRFATCTQCTLPALSCYAGCIEYEEEEEEGQVRV